MNLQIMETIRIHSAVADRLQTIGQKMKSALLVSFIVKH